MAHQDANRRNGHPNQEHEDAEDAMLDPEEADEIVEQDGDTAMDSDGEDDEMVEEVQLHNDSVAHWDRHTDSVYCIAQHPTRHELVATGGGDDMAYLWDSTPLEGPILPQSHESSPQPRQREAREALATLGGQDESVNAICFALPAGDFVVTATLAGKLSVFATATGQPVATAEEVEEINWLAPCPHPQYPHTVAFGAADGSVWIYRIDPSDTASPLTIVQTFVLHQASCTAGAWSPDGRLLATVAEDSSFYLWDAFGDAAAAGVTSPQGSQAVVSLTSADERFRVDGGLYSVAISPGGSIAALGGAQGQIRIVGLPRLSHASRAAKGSGVASKSGRAKHSASAGPAGQAGQILASLQAQSDGIETLDFSQPPLTLLAAGSVDGSIALFDASHNFLLRRHIPFAHGYAEAADGGDPEAAEAVIQVQFVKTPLGSANPSGHVLTSCGNDGVLRRWDARGGNAVATGSKGLLGQWRGHRGGGAGGGILAFVQGGGGARVITAGDDGICLVFQMD